MVANRQALTLLLELASDIEFFHTPDRDAFASVPVNRHLGTLPVTSREFALVLLHRYYQYTSSAPTKAGPRRRNQCFHQPSTFRR